MNKPTPISELLHGIDLKLLEDDTQWCERTAARPDIYAWSPGRYLRVAHALHALRTIIYTTDPPTVAETIIRESEREDGDG